MRGLGYLGVGCLLASLAAGLPAQAESQAKGVPDAPGPVEHVLARHDGFLLPRTFETNDGRRLVKGTYDLALIEAGGRYYIQITSTESGKGFRVAAEATGEIAGGTGEEPGPPKVSIRSERGRDLLYFTYGDLTAAFPLRQARRTG